MTSISDADTDTDTAIAQRRSHARASSSRPFPILRRKYARWRLYSKTLARHPFDTTTTYRWARSVAAHQRALALVATIAMPTKSTFGSPFFCVAQRIANAVQCIAGYQKLHYDVTFIRAKLLLVRRHLRSLRAFLVE